jgi:hypothetical protein
MTPPVIISGDASIERASDPGGGSYAARVLIDRAQQTTKAANDRIDGMRAPERGIAEIKAPWDFQI